MKFSIVVPTYNEQKDIALTLDALVALDYPVKEIIVVDDSRDSTPEIVAQYVERGVRLIRPAKREGRCGARNLGILAATGEVVVILNADVRLPKDFLGKILPYYDEGYDYVLVKSKVANEEDLFARYTQAMAARVEGDDPSWMEWTEGFSCRREMAIRAGLFPTGFAVPICAGEDGFFGNGLKNAGARKRIDFSIVVEHVAPASFSEYWNVRKGRGEGSPQIRRFIQRWSFARLISWAMLRGMKNLVMVALVLPVLFVSWRATRFSQYGLRDLFPFMAAWLVEQVAFHVGEWKSIVELFRAENNEGSRNVGF